MKIRSPQSLPISAAPGTAGRDEVPKQIETGGGADELGKLLSEPPTPDSDQHFPATGEQSLPVTATTASLSSKVSSTAANLTKASAASAPQASDSQSAATPTPQPRARSSRQNTVSQPPSVSTLPDPQKKLCVHRFSAQSPPPVPVGSKPSLQGQRWAASSLAQPPPSAPAAHAQDAYFGQPSTVYANQPSKPMYSKPFLQRPAAPPAVSLSSIDSGLVSTRGPDALRNQTDKSDFEIIVEGIPAKLWDDEDEESLKGLLEEWVPSNQGVFVSVDGDRVLDMKRVGTSARCKIHTSLLSMLRFHFREARSFNVN